MSTITVWRTDTNQKLEIEPDELISTPNGYAIRRRDPVDRTALIPAAPTSQTEAGSRARLPETAARLPETLVRLEERLAGLERRIDAREAMPRVQRVIRDDAGRITGVVSEPAVTNHQSLLRNQ
jgi:hypothetical protein